MVAEEEVTSSDTVMRELLGDDAARPRIFPPRSFDFRREQSEADRDHATNIAEVWCFSEGHRRPAPR